MRRLVLVSSVGLLCVVLISCGSADNEAFRVKNSGPATSGQAVSQPERPTIPTPPPSTKEPSRRPVATPPGIASPDDVMQTPPPPPAAASPTVASQPAVISVPAQVGVGQKGRTLGQPGFLTTPVYVYFRSQEMVAFRIQVPQAMQLFKATNGRAPESHEEFWREIIEANGIKLPQLPPGHRYVYDPAREELLVEQPSP
ncbi:MAG: hypothetical protein ACUVQQ_01955 [Thermogutta sp.]